jgi:transcriptional regulator with XRE-family HTH domain
VARTASKTATRAGRKPYFRDDEFLRGIGAKIRQHRLDRGMTQSDLAFACNDKDYSQINRIELGKVNFSVSYLSLIAGVFGISPKDLLP